MGERGAVVSRAAVGNEERPRIAPSSLVPGSMKRLLAHAREHTCFSTKTIVAAVLSVAMCVMLLHLIDTLSKPAGWGKDLSFNYPSPFVLSSPNQQRDASWDQLITVVS